MQCYKTEEKNKNKSKKTSDKREEKTTKINKNHYYLIIEYVTGGTISNGVAYAGWRAFGFSGTSSSSAAE